jgi:AcrR family transcriptional regulator
MIGRPRDDAARTRILDAAIELSTRDGYPAVTIKGIAEAAGVGRQTVYRWWNSRGAVLAEALAEFGGGMVDPAMTDDPEADLRTFLDATFTLAGRPPVADVLLGVTADSVACDELRATLREFIAVRRNALRTRLSRLGPWKVPLDTAVDLVYGSMWYRLISAHAPVTRQLTDELMPVLDALRATPG